MRSVPSRRLAMLALLVTGPLTAALQAQMGFPVVGARAGGMAGAFVAVADDPVAPHWNPPGLIGGDPVGLTIGWDGFRFRNLQGPARPGVWRHSAITVSLGTWPLGLAYSRLRFSDIVPAQTGGLAARALSIDQIGATVLQSLGPQVTVGGTLKYLRGSAGIAGVSGQTVEAALAAADDTRRSGRSAFDLDLGARAEFGPFRAALTLKNLTRPEFGPIAENVVRLPRLARLGLAWFPLTGLTLALDVDLDRADPLVGLRRTIALGGETRLGAWCALRAGMQWQRRGAAEPAGSLGGSIRVRPGLWLDGYVTGGGSATRQGFGIAMRMGS